MQFKQQILTDYADEYILILKNNNESLFDVLPIRILSGQLYNNLINIFKLNKCNVHLDNFIWYIQYFINLNFNMQYHSIKKFKDTARQCDYTLNIDEIDIIVNQFDLYFKNVKSNL